MKLHQQPVLHPLFKLLEVILECITVFYGTNSKVNYCVICEEPDLGGTCILREGIDEKEKEDRSVDRPLGNTTGDWYSL